MEDQIFHTRVALKEGGIFTFYNVKAKDKNEVGPIACKHAAQQFGGTPDKWEAEFVWDAGVHVDLKKDPIINP